MMPRNYQINIYYECDITHLPSLKQVINWCEQHLQHDWNIVADGGVNACRGLGEHRVIFLCERATDFAYFKLHWASG